MSFIEQQIRLEQFLVSMLLSPAAQSQYQKGSIAHAELLPIAEELRALSHWYTEERTARKALVLSEPSARAYALYYLPINYAKVTLLLRQLPLNFFHTRRRVLDFGCGPGTASLALLDHATSAVDLTLYDSAASMRAVAQTLISAKECKAEVVETFGALQGSFDLIIGAHVLNELSMKERRALLARLISQISDGGYLLLLEPALRDATRALMQDHDWLLSQGVSITFPCTHQKLCPMLQRSANDWCHATLYWARPPLIAQLDALTGFNKHRIKYAACIAKKGAVAAEEAQFRVITPASKVKRGSEALLCGERLYGTALLPKRARTDQNRPFCRLLDFDSVTIEKLSLTGELEKESLVTIIGRAGVLE